jgi:hypothetical protein
MTTNPSQSGTQRGSGSSGESLGKTPGAPASSNMREQVTNAAREGAKEVKTQAANVTESVKDLASQAGDKLMSSVEDQKTAGADFVGDMAGAIRRAAKEFTTVPQAAHYISLAADQIDSVSSAFRKRDIGQLVADVQGFARRQPTAFLGAAVLAGFAAVRFLKTSTASSGSSGAGGDSSFEGDRGNAGDRSSRQRF